jgi:hypothetical protein
MYEAFALRRDNCHKPTAVKEDELLGGLDVNDLAELALGK